MKPPQNLGEDVPRQPFQHQNGPEAGNKQPNSEHEQDTIKQVEQSQTRKQENNWTNTVTSLEEPNKSPDKLGGKTQSILTQHIEAGFRW